MEVILVQSVNEQAFVDAEHEWYLFQLPPQLAVGIGYFPSIEFGV